MKKSFVKILRGGVYIAASSLLLASAVSCNVGLGESVDTEAPTLDITYPPVSAVIRDNFTLYGTCSDDKEVSSVKVSVMNTATKQNVITDAYATVNSSETWQISLNSYDSSNSSYYNGWQFADGTYQVNVTAYDNAGHSSGTVSRTFDIDNTAPVFIISNPGVVKNGSSKASAYGSIFTIDGTISDDHTIASMDVTIYDSDGNIVSNETYDGEQITSFHEDDIATAGGTSVTIAQYGSTTDTRYKELHEADDGTEYYTCSIKLTDSAQVYQNPTGSSARSAAETKADSTGNSTYSLYLYDDVYTKLMSSKKGLGLSAADLKNILNGTSTNDDAKAILDSKKIDTQAQNESTNLYFSLNPQANPTYQVNGFEFSFEENGTIQSASSGNQLSVTVSAGLDGTNIDLDGNDDQKSTVKVWMKEYTTKPSSKSDIISEISSLSAQVAKLENSETTFVQYKDATSENAVTEPKDGDGNSLGWKLIYDYAQANASSGTSESSVSTKTFSVTLPKGFVSLNHYYIVAVTGSDVEDVVFLQNTVYGFEGNEAGIPPTLKISYPANASLQKSSEFDFKGTATINSSSLYVKTLTATLTVTDSDNKSIGTGTATITRSSSDAEWTGDTSVLTCDGSDWKFDIEKLSNYETIKAEEGKSYTYTFDLYGESSSGHNVTTSSYVQIDSTPPVVSISSITPTVDGSEYDSSGNTYVNGTITVKGNVEESNLTDVTMQVFVGGEAASCFTDSNGKATDTLSLGKVYSFSQTIDTTSLTDEKSLDIRVTATDKVGNSATYSSLTAEGTSYGKLEILQETDVPKITLTNASNTSENTTLTDGTKTYDFVTDSSKISEENGNLFGTTTNNKLMATISDDDMIKNVTVNVYKEVYKEDGTTLFDSTTKNVSTDSSAKATYSLTYNLPSNEGIYVVEITATDDVLSTSLSGDRTPLTASTGKFYIAVSKGAPTITVDSYKNGTFFGTVSIKNTTVSASYEDKVESAVYPDVTVTTQPTSDTSWEATLDTSKLTDGTTYKILFTATNAYGQAGTASYTIDATKPTVAISGISPTVTVDSTTYVNGKIKVTGSANDETKLADGNLEISITDKDGNSVPAENLLITTGETNGYTNDISLSGTYKQWIFTLDTTKLTDESSYTIKVTAKDAAGNVSSEATSSINVSQKTDAPVLTLSNASTEITSFDSITGGATNIFGTTSNNYLKGTITDDDGIEKVTVTVTSEDGTVSTDTLLSNGTSTSYTLNYELPETEGGYTVKIDVEDTLGETASYSTAENTVYLAVDSGAPEITLSNTNGNYYNATIPVSGSVSDASGIVSLVMSGNGTSASYGSSANIINTASTNLGTISATTSATLSDTITVSSLDDNTSTGYTATYTATDRWGQSKTASLKYYVDKTKPELSSLADTLGSVTGFSSINNAWFKDEALKAGGQITESGSGISEIQYTLVTNSDSSSESDKTTTTGSFGAKSVTGESYNYTYSSTIGGFATGTNTLTLVALDNAGNKSNELTYTVKIDSTDPEIVEDATKITVNGTESSSSTLLVNGNYDVIVSGQVTDADSKINPDRVYVSLKSKITATGTSLDAIGSAEATKWQKATVAQSSTDSDVYDFTATIPQAQLTEANSGTIYLLITDNAGNRVNNVSLASMTVDKTAPEISLNYPSDADTSTSEIEVNGNITFSGTASDTNELSKISRIEYSTDKSTWTALSDVTFTGTTSWTSSEIDTTKIFTDGTTYYFRAVAVDAAQNEGTSSEITVKVSQDTDRPIVKISGLTKQADGSYILKYVKNSVLSGTVSDDDSQSSKIVDVFYISENAFDSSSLPTESNASFNAASGDWTFTPTDTADGSKEIYLYIKDNAGNVYYTGASSDSSALNLPKLYLGSEKAYDSDTDLTVNNSKFTYVSDSNPPEAGASASGTRYNSSGAKVDVSSDATGVYEASVNSSFTAGGSAMPKASFTFTATDNNGISGAVIEISDSSDTKKVYRRVVGGTYDSSSSKVTLGETEYSVSSSSSASTDSTSGYYRLDGTDSTTENAYLTAEDTTGTITTDVMDFSSFASGQVSVTFTVYDKSGLYSVGSYPFIVDNAGPDIKVSSPSSTTELTGDVSIIGQSTDTYSSASTIQYVVPTNSVYTSYNSSSSDVDLSTLDWTGSISATSTVSSWTFNLDDADNDGLNKYDSTDSARTTYGYTADDGIYTLPIWFKATDTLGNVSYNTTYQVRHNPDGDKPLTDITYPTKNDYSTSGGITAAILNGSIRVTGSSSVPSNTTTINSVYLQIDVDGDGDFDDTDKSALTALGYTVVDYSSAYVVNSEASAILEGFEDTTARDAWWGIAATVKSSSWNISINDSDKIYNAMSGTSPSITNTNKLLHIRASGVNNKGKVGAWSNSVAIKLDSDTPLYEVSLVKLKTSLTSNSSLSSATSDSTQPETTASQEYSSNMYIRGAEGEWYLKIKATDNESVNSVEVSQGNTTLVAGSGFFHSTLGTSGTAQPTVYIYVPVSVASSKVSYKVSISDNADPVNSVTPSFTLNIDNTAPSLSSLTGNSSSLLSSTVPNISDSDYRYTLKGESSDSGSGFERAVFYFVRKDTVGSYTISNNVIIDPYIAYTTSGGTNTYSSKISLDDLEDLSLTQGSDTYHLYGKKVSGSVGTTTTFTPTTSTEITDNKSIRAGGLIYVDGVYRLIESIDSSGVVTFSPACSASISSANAVFPYAQVVDHAGESASDYSPLTWTIAEDDGDGMIENVSEAGASATWTGTIHACNIPDGPVSLVVLVFDAAGNVNGKTIDTFVSNNAPRLAKVNLATDLNGDNIFKQEEFVEYSMYAKAGSTQESYTLNFSDYDAGVFKIKDALAVVPEFTGGNGAISMVFEKDATDATAVTSASGTSVTAASSSSTTSADGSYSITSGTTTVNNVTYTVDSLTFTETDVSSDSRPREASSSMYAYVMDNQQVTGKSSYAETDDGENKAFSFTFWDSTDETSQGSTSQKAVLYVPAFTIDVTDSVAPTGTVTPFYWNGDYSSTETMTASSYNTSENNSIVYYGSTRIGHIDLTGAGTDKNPDISGTIKIEGEIFDDQRIGSVEVVVGADSSGTVTETISATSTYTASSKTWSETGSVSSDGYKLTVTDVSLGQAGHKAKWTLLLDTSKLSNGANAVAVTTTQAKSNSGSALTSTPGTTATTSDELTGYYPVRVVPYITSVARTGSTIAEGSGTSGNINRSKLGHYSVAEGETLTVYGWNFGTSASWSVGTSTGNSASPTAGEQNLYSFTMTVPSVSGALSVTSNSVISVNNSNSNPAISGNKITNGVEGTNGNNAESYSMRGNSTVYYASDDRYFDVWALGNGFANTTGGAEFQMPVMTASADGNLFASWGAASNGQIVFSYGVNGSATPIFNCYDQPAQYTAVAFDKSATSYTAGGASVLYMGEQQGKSGSYSTTGLSSSLIIGGAFVTQIGKDDISNGKIYSGKTAVVSGNPSMKMDSKNTTGYYNLANYDMTRRLGSFANPKAARSGNYLHNIWYDNVTESLKYSVVNLGSQSTSDWENNGAAMAGWVVLDGGYTGQDRRHEWTMADTTTIKKLNNVLKSGGDNHSFVPGSTSVDTQATYFANDIFITSLSSATSTSIKISGTWTTDPAEGDTIALMCNDAGSYTIELRKITSYSNNVVSWDSAISDYENIDSATIYKGNLNVVEGSLDSLDSAAAASGSSGSSADIDLDSNGMPVVAYFDDNSSTLRIAKATNAEPDLESEWVRTTTDLTCSGSVSVAVDSGDNIHVVYKDQDGQMCYAFGTLGSDNKYTLHSEVIDAATSSDYVKISVIESSDSKIPCVTYLNSAGTAQCLKYAYRTSSPSSSDTFSADNWDYMILPSLGNGRYALTGNPVSLEGRKTGWTTSSAATITNGGTSVTPATVQAAVAFKSKTQFETAYLKTE